MSYPNILFGPEGLQYKQSTSARQALGQMLVLEDGRRFRYAKNGAVAATPGLLFQGAALPSAASLTSLTISAMAAGDKTFTLTTSLATTIAAGVMDEGYFMTITSAGGGGQTFKLATGQPALTCAVSTNTLTLDYGVPAAISSSVKATIIRNPYSGVIVHPGPQTALAVGWTMSCLAASAYGWLGTAGPLAGLVDMDPQIYRGVSPSTALAGAVNQAYMRIDAATSAAATTQTHNVLQSTGGAGSVWVMTSAASTSGVKDLGMQQLTVGWAMSSGYTSGQYGALFATLDS